MKNIKVICLSSIGAVIMGCAVSSLPEFVAKPEPPMEWQTHLETKAGCPNVTGQYESTPEVAELQKDGSWHVSNGNWYDYLLLMPFSRSTAVKRNPNKDVPGYPPNSLIIQLNEQENTFQIISPDKNNENFQTHIFSEVANDYTCQAGKLVFPEFKIQGGTEGSTLNGKTIRLATVNSRGDLLFYEQTQSHKTIHKYYLFKSN